MQKLQQHQKSEQRLSPQQIQLLQLLALPSFALVERINQELEANPALEENPSAEAENTETEFTDNEDIENLETREDEPISWEEASDEESYYKKGENSPFESAEKWSLLEYMQNQILSLDLDEQAHAIAELIIGNLDEKGYLQRDTVAIADDLAFYQGIATNLEAVEAVLEQVQSLDPAGIAARNLQECLTLQILRMAEDEMKGLALRLLKLPIDWLLQKQYKKIEQKLHIDSEILHQLLVYMGHLNPNPASAVVENQTENYIYPDAVVHLIQGKPKMELLHYRIPSLQVSDYFKELVLHNDPKNNTAIFAKERMRLAENFINALNQRKNTLLNIFSALLRHQEAYFLSGNASDIKPLTLKDLAQELNMDVSTMSRALQAKYFETPWGLVGSRTLFGEKTTKSDGEEVSTKALKEQLAQIIAGENPEKPYSDEELAQKLTETGFLVARRTVTKYREHMGIAVGRLRKK